MNSASVLAERARSKIRLISIGTLDPGYIHTLGIYIDRIVQVAPSGTIERRTVRKRGEYGLDT
jgi:hypothetical protein